MTKEEIYLIEPSALNKLLNNILETENVDYINGDTSRLFKIIDKAEINGFTVDRIKVEYFDVPNNHDNSYGVAVENIELEGSLDLFEVRGKTLGEALGRLLLLLHYEVDVDPTCTSMKCECGKTLRYSHEGTSYLSIDRALNEYPHVFSKAIAYWFKEHPIKEMRNPNDFDS